MKIFFFKNFFLHFRFHDNDVTSDARVGARLNGTSTGDEAGATNGRDDGTARLPNSSQKLERFVVKKKRLFAAKCADAPFILFELNQLYIFDQKLF
jgi:hypothetical protein